MVERDPVKPLPPQQSLQTQMPPMPFEDEPLVNQQMPEQPAFVDAYNRVNRPRITVFMNRTLEGDVIPVNPRTPDISVEETRTGKNAGTDSTAVYLQQGQYDDAWAKSLDYEAVEATLAEWLSCNGQITMISPTLARQRLTDQQVKELQSGRPQALSEIAQQLGVDILIQVQAHPTQQYADGLRVRCVAEAMNTHGGESLGRVVADFPLPLDKPTMNKFTRFMARKLMDDMTSAWTAPLPAGTPAPGAEGAAPQQQPQPQQQQQESVPPAQATSPSAPASSPAQTPKTVAPAAPVPPPLPAATNPAQ
jgi:hypothetical protein